MAEVRVGVSGWTYAPWRGDFYPKGLRQRDELAYAAARLTAIEINGSFYALQKPESYRRWREETPDDFVFALKGSRFITHMKKLADPAEPLRRFFEGVWELGPKLGPVLWQLPQTHSFDPERLDAFFAAVPRESPEGRPVRHALEFRSPTFATSQAYDLLRRHDVAVVLADTAGRWPRVEEDTAGFRYVRLHGDQELYASGYDAAALERWAATVSDWAQRQDVFVFFDNDIKGYAPRDAMGLIERLAPGRGAQNS
ncbi:DUF72 domain-containing protein [Nocardioides mangrovicus]|uniref:DUF72 domain-containing protein n=1 Tax=Nocardioides mangrovicus TaxID=2478913 RepID=A0A3L8P2N9_9ACTN|nr:DUF72 domain-containing protein [Nocardioides mangrovicus]RLV49232.1 DUF72 domain-containing protein [Nocardioides mangrovicus]